VQTLTWSPVALVSSEHVRPDAQLAPFAQLGAQKISDPNCAQIPPLQSWSVTQIGHSAGLVPVEVLPPPSPAPKPVDDWAPQPKNVALSPATQVKTAIVMKAALGMTRFFRSGAIIPLLLGKTPTLDGAPSWRATPG
jgi:hypothetical protein